MKYIFALRNAIDELITEKNAYVVGEDIMEPYGGAFKVTKGLSEKYPNNIIGTPMSEQGFTAISVGMALMGDYVIEEIMFGDFITLAADQLINHAAKFNDLYGQKMHLVLRTPSGAYRGYGATHSQSLEKMFLGIPGLRVVAPNIYINVGDFLKSVIDFGKPTLFIENKLDYPKELTTTDFELFGRAEEDFNVRISIKGETPEITIVTYGGLAEMAVNTARKLMYEEEIAADVVIASDLSKEDNNSMFELVRTDKILFVEESTGGFGFSAQAAFEAVKRGKQVDLLTSLSSTIPSAKVAEYDVLVQDDDIFKASLSLINK